MDQLELFHRIADEGSARVRRFVVDRELLGSVRFRNLAYPEVARDFTLHGGGETPALWDGERLHSGVEAALARLQALLDSGQSA